MAVALDAAGTQATAVTGVTIAYTGLTVGSGSDRALVVVMTWLGDPGTVTVARWDDAASNQDLTLLQTATAATGQAVKIYGLVNPIAGNKTLRITWTNLNEHAINAVAWTGADQTGGATSFPNSATTTGNSNTASITITLPSSGAGVSGVVGGTGTTLSSVSATQLMLVSGVGAFEAGASRSTSSGTFTGTFSGTNQWGIVATGVAPSGAAGAAPSPNRLALLGAGA